MAEEEKRFIETFRENPEVAIQCITMLLKERKENESEF